MRHHDAPNSPNRADLDTVTMTFGALADPTRARLVLALADVGEASVGELVAGLSKHLNNKWLVHTWCSA